MKRAALILIIVLVLAAVALAFVGANSVAPTPMGGVSVSPAGYVTRVVAGVKAHFTSGQTEMQRAFAAKREVKSYRMTTLLSLHPGQPLKTVIEVSCPDRERFTTTIGERSFHAVRIGGKAYTEQQDGTWLTQEIASNSWAPCGSNPGDPAPWAVMNEGRDPSVVLSKMADHAEFERGAFVTTPEGNCQQWTVRLTLPGGAEHGHGPGGLSYTICLDNKHLPVAVSMGRGGMVTSYSDWNKEVQIDAPKM
ncbi:MAG TPA: hypothetical protein VFR84_13620 [Candidatus Angelobacter sp.]|nr:hypothetical protein [Candidatus Angelobacter sp.]